MENISPSLTAKFYFPYDRKNWSQSDKDFFPELPQDVGLDLSTAAIGAVANLAAKAVGSLLDKVAAKTQSRALITDVNISLDGLYDQTGQCVLNGAYLILHNSISNDPMCGTIFGCFLCVVSPDRTAFKFIVKHWQFRDFLKTIRGQWLQRQDVRDFALKIEFLSPGSSTLGNRVAYIEHVVIATTVSGIEQSIKIDQHLSWIALPPRPTGLPVENNDFQRLRLYFPFNVRITVVETTKPNQFGEWLRTVAIEQKLAITSGVIDFVKQSLDVDAIATADNKATEAAAAGYNAYKLSWDDAYIHLSRKPNPLGDAPTELDKTRHSVETASWEALLKVKNQVVLAKKTVAFSTFSKAHLPWPGNLPEISN